MQTVKLNMPIVWHTVNSLLFIGCQLLRIALVNWTKLTNISSKKYTCTIIIMSLILEFCNLNALKITLLLKNHEQKDSLRNMYQ